MNVFAKQAVHFAKEILWLRNLLLDDSCPLLLIDYKQGVTESPVYYYYYRYYVFINMNTVIE